MSMFEFPNDYFEKMNSSNPFAAFMPSPDQMNTMVKDWMEMVPASNPFAENIDLAAFTLENTDMPTNPAAAAAAGSAIMLGMASQMFGLMAGSISSAMEQADKLKGGAGDMDFSAFTAAVPNPFKPNWDFGSSDAAGPAKSAKPAPRKAAADAVQKTSKAVKDMTDEAVRTADALAAEGMEAAAKSAAATEEAVAETINPAVGTVLKPEVVGEIKAPSPKAKAAPVKKASAAKSKPAPAKKTEAVNDDVAPAELKVATTPATAAPVADEVMPEDFIKPKAFAKPDAPDDLKLISGVGPKLEQVLNGLGIWTFGQIAEWTPNEIAWVDDYLQFKGRIGRDEWLKQAAELARG